MKAKQKPKPKKDAAERIELFKQVALIQLKSRVAGVLKGSADGAIMCPHFMDDIALIAEGILKAAKTFGEK